ncbi:MAG TPA: lasso peptide biosynthesis B2 protein, partial [Steroidobacteraceae bacterium]|nr:lasso peptide biosynthesis B2 protein [Steroidobacteraceae bacterium]
LALPAHVHVCADGDHVVFLDLKSDRYWALPAVSTRGFSAQVKRWSVRRADDDDAPSADAATLETLCARGLLCDEASGLCDEASVASSDGGEVAGAPTPRRDLTMTRSAAPRSTRLASFVYAATVAALTLKARGLQHAVARTSQRRLARSRASSVPRNDFDSAAELVASFERLRPLLFSARDACLFHSFALIEFLAQHDCYPHLLLGVRARPFAAHCWVQLDDTVLNDAVEHVSRYTPIMVA